MSAPEIEKAQEEVELASRRVEFALVELQAELDDEQLRDPCQGAPERVEGGGIRVSGGPPVAFWAPVFDSDLGPDLDDAQAPSITLELVRALCMVMALRTSALQKAFDNFVEAADVLLELAPENRSTLRPLRDVAAALSPILMHLVPVGRVQYRGGDRERLAHAAEVLKANGERSLARKPWRLAAKKGREREANTLYSDELRNILRRLTRAPSSVEREHPRIFPFDDARDSRSTEFRELSEREEIRAIRTVRAAEKFFRHRYRDVPKKLAAAESLLDSSLSHVQAAERYGVTREAVRWWVDRLRPELKDFVEVYQQRSA